MWWHVNLELQVTSIDLMAGNQSCIHHYNLAMWISFYFAFIGVRSVFELMTARATEISNSSCVSCMTFVEISLLKVYQL